MPWSIPELLTGAYVEHCAWEGDWLVLRTRDGEIHLSPKTIGLEFHCPKCLEVRLVEQVKDARGVQGVCAVCAFSWWIKGEPCVRSG